MKLRRIGFQGYKPFPGDGRSDQYQSLELAPLTLIFGKNNSGKSAVLRLPRLILGGLECNDGQVLPLEVRGLRYGASFVDLIHGGAFFSRPSFQVLAEHEGESLDIAVTLYSRSALTDDEPPRIWSYEMRSPEVLSIGGPSERASEPPKYSGLLPGTPRWNNWRAAATSMLNAMIHLGPMREPVKATYPNETPTALGFDGATAPQLLRTEPLLADDVAAWFEAHLEGWRLSLKRDADSFSLWISRSSSLVSRLSLGGEGLQQVLPVVVHQFWRQRGEHGAFLDLVEQPELHLHAAVQASLADLFLQTALRGQGQIVVETHSKPILLRVQRRVAEGMIRPDQVAIYFTEMADQGCQLLRIGLNDDGELDRFPPGVFEEDFGEVAAIRRAQRKRHAKPRG